MWKRFFVCVFLVVLPVVSNAQVLRPALTEAQRERQCFDLWYERAAVFARRGLCFGHRFGSELFDGYACNTFNPDEVATLTQEDEFVENILRVEETLACRVDTGRSPPPWLRERAVVDLVSMLSGQARDPRIVIPEIPLGVNVSDVEMAVGSVWEICTRDGSALMAVSAPRRRLSDPLAALPNQTPVQIRVPEVRDRLSPGTVWSEVFFVNPADRTQHRGFVDKSGLSPVCERSNDPQISGLRMTRVNPEMLQRHRTESGLAPSTGFLTTMRRAQNLPQPVFPVFDPVLDGPRVGGLVSDPVQRPVASDEILFPPLSCGSPTAVDFDEPLTQSLITAYTGRQITWQRCLQQEQAEDERRLERFVRVLGGVVQNNLPQFPPQCLDCPDRFQAGFRVVEERTNLRQQALVRERQVRRRLIEEGGRLGLDVSRLSALR